MSVENVNEITPLWVIILVGALSGVIGSVLGPIIQRLFTRNDRALEARRVWAREKLQTVFGVGDKQHPSDGPRHYFLRIVPPSGYTAHLYNMHAINWAVEESVDLMMLQPARSAWARQWLLYWHFALRDEAAYLHEWLHILRRDEQWNNEGWNKANAAYERRVRRVESALSIWAVGQWLTHPSLRMWLSGRRLAMRWHRRRLHALEKAHGGHHGENVDYVKMKCDCVDEEALAAMYAAQEAEQTSTDS